MFLKDTSLLEQEDKITDRIMQAAVKTVFDRHHDVNDFESKHGCNHVFVPTPTNDAYDRARDEEDE